MSVKLNINANVTGSNQVKGLNRNLTNTRTASRGASRALKDLDKVAQRGRAAIAGLSTALNVGLAAGFAAVTAGAGKFVKDTFEAGNTVEGLAIRFKLLFGSVEEGAKAFDTLTNFAAKVPFSLEEISKGSGNLAVIAKDADELNRILEITGNVAAATGLDFRQTAEQIQRSFAGGIASADVFRERGVRAMLGFEAGVKVSVEETKKRFFEVFGKGGQFGQATGDLAQTLVGQVSMVQDKYFKFRQIVSKQFFTSLTDQIKRLNKDIESQEEAFNKLATEVGNKLASAFLKLESAIKFIASNFDTIGSAVKAFIAYKLAGVIANITVAFATLNTVMRANPLGLIITSVQLAVAAFVAFEDQIKNLYNNVLNKLLLQFNNLKLGVINLIEVLNKVPGINIDVAEQKEKVTAAIIDQENAINGLAASYTKLSKEQKDYFREDGGVDFEKLARRKAYVQPNPQGDMAAEAITAAENRMREVANINERIDFMNRRIIIDEAKKTAANKEQVKQARTYRDLLEEVNVTSELVGDAIGSKWVQSLRDGNGLINATVDAFKNMLDVIAETIIKQTIQLGVEKIFEALGNKKVENEKKLNAEKLKGLAISKSQALASAFTTAVGFLGFNKGGIVPGGAPYNDRVPAMLTPGELVVPRDQVNKGLGGATYQTTINQNINTNDLNSALLSAVRTNAEEVNAILDQQKDNG